MVATLPLYGLILKWGVSVVFIAKALYAGRPTLHYSVERHLNLNGRDTSLIWTYSQVGRKCCFHNQRATLHARRSRCTARVWRWR